MERTLAANLKSKVGQTILLKGWVHTLRKQGSLIFVLLRDRTGLVQLIVEKNSAAFAVFSKITVESVVAVTGTAKAEQQAPGGYELSATTVEVLSEAAPELPIPVNEKIADSEANQNARLDWRWLDLRKPERYLIFQTWTLMEQAWREFALNQGFLQVHSPKMMSTPSESGAELFEIKYFDRVAYLAQSPQFYKQMAQAAGFEGIIEVGPVFRADPSFTSRHATEFTGFDLELSFIDSHHDVMDFQAEQLAYTIKAVKEQLGDHIKEVYDRELVVPKTPFPKITMAEAKKMLAKKKIKSEKEGDLSPEEERELGVIIKERDNHEFVLVTDYPKSVRPFYHMRHTDNPELTKSYDLLFNGVEITTGAQREHRYDVLRDQIKEQGLAEDTLKDYLNFFKYGCPPHGGYGMGPARVLMKLLNIDNIREVTYLYRGVKRLTP